MIQGYFLSIIYLIVSSLLSYLSKYRLSLSFMLRFSDLLKNNKKISLSFFFIGLLTSLLLLFFPIYPGPTILGDLMIALVVLYDALYFFVDSRRAQNNDRESYLNPKKERRMIFLARLSLVCAIIHFLFPSLVLI